MRRSPPARQLASPLAGLLAPLLLAVSACLPSAEREAVELAFVEVAGIQGLRATTAEISTDHPESLEHLGQGWKPIDLEPLGAPLELALRRAQLWFFAHRGETGGVEIELEPAGAEVAGKALLVRLNGHDVDQPTLEAGRRSYRVSFPAEKVSAGLNGLQWVLDPTDPTPGGRDPGLRVHRIRFLDGDGEPLGPGGRRIAVRESEGRSVFEMPGESVVELAAELPAAGRWRGRFEVLPAAAGGSGGAEVTVRAELEVAGEAARTLFERAFPAGQHDAASFELDLEPWAGRLASARLRVLGPASAAVRWREARITGRGETPPAFEPLDRKPAPVSGRLGRPDVFVILLDAARADAFSPFGGPHPSPGLEALAGHGTRFERAFSPASWTGQSVPAILGGHTPDALGVFSWSSPVAPAAPLLPELLAEAGYHTVLFTQHPFYGFKPTLRRGFREVIRAPRQRTDALPAAADLLRDDRPTFAFIHLLPPHAPYEPPPPFRGAYSGWYRGSISADPGFLNGFSERRQPVELTPEDVRYLRDRYLEMAAYADSLVAEMTARLEAADRLDDALVIVLSDHGEAFYEHGSFLHTQRLYREVVHVPLVVKWPAGTRGFAPVVEESVSLIDVAPTLVDALGLGGGELRFQGSSWLPRVFDRAPLPAAVFTTTRGAAKPEALARPWAGLELDGWRLLWNRHGRTAELYDLARDPWEQDDLAAERPLRALLLEQALLRQLEVDARIARELSRDSGGAEEQIAPEAREQLRALGYL